LALDMMQVRRWTKVRLGMIKPEPQASINLHGT